MLRARARSQRNGRPDKGVKSVPAFDRKVLLAKARFREFYPAGNKAIVQILRLAKERT